MNIVNLIIRKIIIHTFVVTVNKKSFLYFGHKRNVIISSKIFNLLKNTSVMEGKSSKGIITLLTKNTEEGDVLPTVIKLPLSQAIRRMTKELKNGYFDQSGKWLSIYLTDVSENGGEPLRLDLRRYGNGGGFGLYVEKVDPNYVFFLDYGNRIGFLSN